MTSTFRRLLTLLPVLGLAGAGATARTAVLTVTATEGDRAVQVVTFPIPKGMTGELVARHEGGAILPVQIENGQGTVLIPELKAGKSLNLKLESGAPTTGKREPGVVVERTSGSLAISVGGKPAFSYQMDKEALPRADIKPVYKRAGYIHPIYTAGGTVVSDDYPPQHVHHHGIWTPWTKTTFQGRDVDFWNMAAKNGATVEFVAVDRTTNGRVYGGFVARHKFVDLTAKPDPVVALNETWEVTAYDVPMAIAGVPVRVFELKTTQTCATDDPLILPEYHYGGFGFRGRGEWFGEKACNFLTSEGTTDRLKANHERARWVHLWGQLPGGPAGMTVMGHPENFRAPQPVRVHPKEPYVSLIPSQLGEWRIEPGKPYVARYRFVAFDGEPDRARLEAIWNGYAKPVVIKIQPAP